MKQPGRSNRSAAQSNSTSQGRPGDASPPGRSHAQCHLINFQKTDNFENRFHLSAIVGASAWLLFMEATTETNRGFEVATTIPNRLEAINGEEGNFKEKC